MWLYFGLNFGVFNFLWRRMSFNNKLRHKSNQRNMGGLLKTLLGLIKIL